MRLFICILVIVVLSGCSDQRSPDQGSMTDSMVKQRFEEIASLSSDYQLPSDWTLRRSEANKFELAVPPSGNFNEAFYVSLDPSVSFGVSARNDNRSIADELKVNRNSLTRRGKVLYEKIIESDEGKTNVIGYLEKDGLCQLAKIVVTTKSVYCVAVTMNTSRPDDFSDSRLGTYFRSFRLIGDGEPAPK